MHLAAYIRAQLDQKTAYRVSLIFSLSMAAVPAYKACLCDKAPATAVVLRSQNKDML
jgi:hypothetical protein